LVAFLEKCIKAGAAWVFRNGSLTQCVCMDSIGTQFAGLLHEEHVATSLRKSRTLAGAEPTFTSTRIIGEGDTLGRKVRGVARRAVNRAPQLVVDGSRYVNLTGCNVSNPRSDGTSPGTRRSLHHSGVVVDVILR
jgi:hypothetical protein